MRIEHLYSVDLSLLVVLVVLLEERSVTRAARRLGRSQPAVSRALQRLRALLDDPLFVRDGVGLEPTPRALALLEPLGRALQSLDRQVLSPPAFDPATDERELRIAVADFAEGMFLPMPLAELSRQAPGIQVVLLANPTGWSIADVLNGEAHMAVSPLSSGGVTVRSVSVGHESFAVLLRRDHPLVEGFDLAAYAAAPHLLVAPSGTPGGVVDRMLEQSGLSRRVAVRTRHFHTAPALLAHSDLIATLPRRFAAQAARRHDLVVLDPPMDIPGFDLKVAWHERWQHDPGHRWIRGMLARSLREQMGS
ncbi:MAG: LysR family transcriptional regulator [Alphaproteobacteria bacterium]|nr:LysR family transcriptional regulator [Alphaproteobacteria bacterium]